MNFKDNRPIYVQIADRIGEEVVRGVLTPDARVPAVRDYAARLEVNVNTVMRAFELLQGAGIIYNRRGIGYFVAADARARVASMRRERFLRDDVPEFFKQAELLGFTADDVARLYAAYLDDKGEKKSE